MPLHDVVANAATTEGSSEEVKREILKTRDATFLALAVLLAVAVAAVGTGPVSAQQYNPCQPSYWGGNNSGCYPSYGNNQYNNCQNGYYYSNCGYSGYNNPYNNYNNQYNPYGCQSGYWNQGNHCYGYGYSNPYYKPYYPYYNCKYGYGYYSCYYPGGYPYYRWHR